MQRSVSLFACLLALGATAGLAAEPRALADGVLFVPGGFVAGQQPDGNSVLLRGGDGWIVVDTGRHAAHTQAVLDAAAAAHLPIRAVINTHWHLDHVGGNGMVRKAFPDVRVVASNAIADALTGFLARYRAQLVELAAQTEDPGQRQAFATEIALIDGGKALAPDDVVTASGERTIAGRALDLELTDHAVTAADVWIVDPATRIVIAGDLVTLPVPFLDTACPAHWRATLDAVGRRDFTTLVPGHGPPMTRAQFDTYRRAFGNLLDCAATKAEKEVCVGAWIKDAGELLAGEDPKFVRSLLDYYLDAHLRSGDAAKAAALCDR